jgi:hypothetical protein
MLGTSCLLGWRRTANEAQVAPLARLPAGEDPFAQVRRAEQDGGPRTLVASGISCHEQLSSGLREVIHPVEMLSGCFSARSARLLTTEDTERTEKGKKNLRNHLTNPANIQPWARTPQ